RSRHRRTHHGGVRLHAAARRRASQPRRGLDRIHHREPSLRGRGWIRRRASLGSSHADLGRASSCRHRRRREAPMVSDATLTTPVTAAPVSSPGSSAPIGVFDSGLGGLTVAHAIMRQLPSESLVYFGDTARVPYGPKSPETVRRYSREISAFLLEQGVKAIVVACNTATAHALPSLREELDVPVIGVVEPGARAAVRATRSGHVGVIGTAGTIRSQA